MKLSRYSEILGVLYTNDYYLLLDMHDEDSYRVFGMYHFRAKLRVIDHEYLNRLKLNSHAMETIRYIFCLSNVKNAFNHNLSSKFTTISEEIRHVTHE